MSLYSKVKESILANKVIKESGNFVGIPTPFKRLAEYIPVIERGHSIGILAATGAGKSRFARWHYIYHPYSFYKKTGYKTRIFYFALEDAKEKVYKNLICHYLYENYKIYISLQELDSKGDRILPDFVVEKIEEATDFFEEFEQIVTIVDGIHSPTEIYNYLEKYALRTGKIEKYDVVVEGEIIKQSVYTPTDNVHTIILVDNMSNIETDQNSPTEREAMILFCKKYVRERLCNFFKFTVVQVVQQDFQSERQSFTKDGASIIAKLEPSLAAIGEAKTISRSFHVCFGIFNPSRFGLMQYPTPSRIDPDNTYRLDILGNRFRSLSILKCNDSDFGMKVPFLFEAVSEVMTELPKPKTPELEDIYNKIKNKHPEKFEKTKGVVLQFTTTEDEEAPF